MVYKEKDAQLEDNRSTAYTFLGVGIAGLIFVILFALDIIKLPMWWLATQGTQLTTTLFFSRECRMHNSRGSLPTVTLIIAN